jgi:hypothetical protein
MPSQRFQPGIRGLSLFRSAVLDKGWVPSVFNLEVVTAVRREPCECMLRSTDCPLPFVEKIAVKFEMIVVLGVLLFMGALVGCDSKPTPAEGPAPPPPAGHQNYAQQKTKVSPTGPGATPPSQP